MSCLYSRDHIYVCGYSHCHITKKQSALLHLNSCSIKHWADLLFIFLSSDYQNQICQSVLKIATYLWTSHCLNIHSNWVFLWFSFFVASRLQRSNDVTLDRGRWFSHLLKLKSHKLSKCMFVNVINSLGFQMSPSVWEPKLVEPNLWFHFVYCTDLLYKI